MRRAASMSASARRIDLETVVATANNVIDPEVKLHCFNSSTPLLSLLKKLHSSWNVRSDKKPDGKYSPKSFERWKSMNIYPSYGNETDTNNDRDFSISNLVLIQSPSELLLSYFHSKRLSNNVSHYVIQWIHRANCFVIKKIITSTRQ